MTRLLFPKTKLSKKNRLPTQLIEVVNGTKRFIPYTHALRAVDEGRAVIADGRLRFTTELELTGVTEPDDTFFRWRRKPSAGFVIKQALRILQTENGR